MIRGKNIYLRTVRETDLDFYDERAIFAGLPASAE
jgi:hypothetical protein